MPRFGRRSSEGCRMRHVAERQRVRCDPQRHKMVLFPVVLDIGPPLAPTVVYALKRRKQPDQVRRVVASRIVLLGAVGRWVEVIVGAGMPAAECMDRRCLQGFLRRRETMHHREPEDRVEVVERLEVFEPGSVFVNLNALVGLILIEEELLVSVHKRVVVVPEKEPPRGAPVLDYQISADKNLDLLVDRLERL